MTSIQALYMLLKEAHVAYGHLRGVQKVRFLKAYGQAYRLMSPGQKSALTKAFRLRAGAR